MRAVGYIRISDEERAREGYGMAAQEHSIRCYCQAHGWELVGVYCDAGKSGKSIKGRSELVRMIADAKVGCFERVCFWKLDRLGRNLQELLEICDDLEAAGVGIVSVVESIDTGTATGRMMRNLLGTFAQYERETIIDPIKAGLAEKARQGYLIGSLSLGYRRDDDGQVVVDPVTAPLIKALFERYVTGAHSVRDLVPWCASIGLRSVEGNLLDRLSIRKILSNVFYTGQLGYKLRSSSATLYNGKHPAIVDVALFAQVQAALAGRRTHGGSTRPFGKEPYPLSGTAYCGACGSPMLGTARIIEHRWRYRYMRCTVAARQGAHACVQPMVRAEHLEEQVRAYIAGMKLSAEDLGTVVTELRRRHRQRDINPSEITGLQRELKRWQRLFTLGEIEEEDYRRESSTIRRQLAELEQPAQVLDVEKAVNLLRDMGNLWRDRSRRVQREFVMEVSQRIEIAGKRVGTIMPKPSCAALFVLDRLERFGG